MYRTFGFGIRFVQPLEKMSAKKAKAQADEQEVDSKMSTTPAKSVLIAIDAVDLSVIICAFVFLAGLMFGSL